MRATRNLTKAVLADRVYATVEAFTKIESAAAVDLLFTLLKETSARGEIIKIVRFGNFTLIDKCARPGRDPKSGEPIARGSPSTRARRRHPRSKSTP